MLYIITEDSNSARDFWECVANTFKDASEFTLVPFLLGSDGKPSAGNSTLNAQVSSLLPKLKVGDTLFIAFDNVAATSKGFNPYNFINKVHNACMNIGVNFKFTSYYCFEELYLSYEELLDMNRKYALSNSIVFDALNYVYKKLITNKNYYDNSREIQNFINMYTDAGVNREHFANQLLMEATKMLSKQGHFKITKASGVFNKQAECWLKDCMTIQQTNMASQQITNVCDNRCSFCCKNKVTRDKLIDLDTRSLSKNSQFSLRQI